MAIRIIVELPTSAGPYAGLNGEERQDAIVDALIGALDTDEVQILDLVEEDEPVWLRTSRF